MSITSTFALVSVDPEAKNEWNRCSVRELFSHGDIDFKSLSTQGLSKGDYLVKISISVEVVETNAQPQEPEVQELEALVQAPDYSIVF